MSSNKEAINITTKSKPMKTHLLKTLLARDDNRQLKINWPIDLI
jgi:hypothetical protein